MASTLEERVQKLESRAERAKEDTTAIITTAVDTLARVKSVERRMASLEDRVASLEDRVASLETGMAWLKRGVQALLDHNGLVVPPDADGV